MSVFVTGGTGFLGRNIIRSLCDRGSEVRALVRSESGEESVAELGAVPVFGDVLDPRSITEALDGCDLVFHVAGVNDPCPSDPAHLYRVNVDGARTVVRCAAEGGVGRVVVTSSAAAIGEPTGVLATEETPHSGSYLSHYARSKKLGENAAFDEGVQRGVDVVAVLPSSVHGPGRADGTAALIRYAITVGRPFVVDTTLSLVDIADCTNGHILAARRGAPGRRYLLSGATLSIREALELLSVVTGRRIRPIRVPRGVAGAAAPLADVAGRWLKNAPLCGDMVRTLIQGHRIDGSLASRELGLVYTPVEETLLRTVTWFEESGFLGGRPF